MNSKEKVSEVLQYLGQRESTGKPLPASDQLTLMLNELLEGRIVPVPIFQCIDFEWMAAQTGQYPKVIAKTDLISPICGFYEEDILEVTKKLSALGTPQLLIIIPDSELYDYRAFSFAQNLQERKQMALDYQIALPKRLAKICDAGGSVILWSEYCSSFGLASPQEYTTKNREMIKQDKTLENKIRGQAKDSRRFLINKGLDSTYIAGIPNETMEEKVGWYCAMYAGEGQALFDSKAITINLEDGRVPAWFQRGAGNSLPILSPVNPNSFYTWRKQQI